MPQPETVDVLTIASGASGAAICEDLPYAHNRVTLGPVLTDAHGISSPKIG